MFVTYLKYALVWDLAIVLLIGGGIALALLALQPGRIFLFARLPNHALVKRNIPPSIGVLGALLALTVFYGSFIEPRIITVTEVQVSLPVEKPLTIVALSDFEVGPYKGRRFVQRVVDKVNAIDPDIVLLLGDYIYYKADHRDSLLPLADLHPRYGVYAVMGNHEYSCFTGSVTRKKYVGFDYSLKVRRALERVGVRVLRNEHERIETEFGELFVAGIDDMCTAREDLAATLPKIQRKAPIILLAHDPSVILDNRATYPHLILAGHTHGGQIRFPLLGPLSPLPTQLGRSVDQGLFAIDKNTTLAITRGLGESGARARLFAPPEILVIQSSLSPST